MRDGRVLPTNVAFARRALVRNNSGTFERGVCLSSDGDVFAPGAVRVFFRLDHGKLVDANGGRTVDNVCCTLATAIAWCREHSA